MVDQRSTLKTLIFKEQILRGGERRRERSELESDDESHDEQRRRYSPTLDLSQKL